MMDRKKVFKIKDSVDLFLSNNKYIMVYYMNTRQRKSFRINEEMIHLLESIDGKRDVENLIQLMENNWDVSSESTVCILETLLSNRIITEVVEHQEILSPELLERYKRQINYFSEFLGNEIDGIIAQKKLLDSHVFIFGCGAVGGDIAIQLAMAGIGQISIFDYDDTQPSDLSRHIYYREEYLYNDKVISLEQELKRINSDIKVNTYHEVMRPETEIESRIKDVDFVINTLDEPYIGYLAAKLSRICIKYRIPHYIAGGFDAHLASTGEIIIPYITPCVECYADHFKVTLKDWKPKKHPVRNRYAEIGGLASMSLFSSSFACIEIIKYIAGLIKMQESYKVRGEFLFHDMSLTYLNVKRNPNCPICGGGMENES